VRVERAQSLAGRIIGPYRILDLLGAGGMGEVYTARDQHLERNVAIKVLPEAFTHDRERIDRFRREAQLLAAVNHPNIATIHGLEEADGVLNLVMELVPGPKPDARGPLLLRWHFLNATSHRIEMSGRCSRPKRVVG